MIAPASISRPIRALLLLVAVVMAGQGCALDPGVPWGRLELKVSARFAPVKDRLTAGGALKTATNEAIAVHEFAIRVESVSASVVAAATNTDFDPANPPPGYSLCHNGHCHKDDGTLPTYDEIKLELAGAAGGGNSVTWAAEDKWIKAATTAVSIPISACAPSCDVPHGKLAGWHVRISATRVRGTRQKTDEKGDHPVGPELAWTAHKTVKLARPAAVRFDRDHDPGAAIDMVIDLPASVFDDVVLAKAAVGAIARADGAVDLSNIATVSEAVHEKLTEDTGLSLHITRSEL